MNRKKTSRERNFALLSEILPNLGKLSSREG